MIKTYTMLPIKRPDGVIPIKPPPKVPILGVRVSRTPYRILALKENETIATICSNMKPTDGLLSVADVSMKKLGIRSVKIGDILSYEPGDAKFERPMIIHRASQKHQHPEQLIAPDEK